MEENQLRKNKIKYITENIINLTDTYIFELYKTICQYIPNSKYNKNIIRYDANIYIESNLRHVNKTQLDNLYKIVYDVLDHTETDGDKKKRITLEIINQFLEKMNMVKIKDFLEFKNVRRELLISEDFKNLVEDNKDYIFTEGGFSKHDCGVYSKQIKTPQISIFKGMLNQIGYELESESKRKTTKGECKCITYYSIKHQNI
jgi:hypothetical protein